MRIMVRRPVSEFFRPTGLTELSRVPKWWQRAAEITGAVALGLFIVAVVMLAGAPS